METKKQEFKYSVYDHKNELSTEDLNLVNEAEQSLTRAHAPYSGFKVGAAVLFTDGTMVSANNQENAAYPSGLCAERVAMFYAKSQFPNKTIKSVAISALSEKGPIRETVSPCGACRQVLAEYEHLQKSSIRVIFLKSQHSYIVCEGIQQLLPFGFNADSL